MFYGSSSYFQYTNNHHCQPNSRPNSNSLAGGALPSILSTKYSKPHRSRWPCFFTCFNFTASYHPYCRGLRHLTSTTRMHSSRPVYLPLFLLKSFQQISHLWAGMLLVSKGAQIVLFMISCNSPTGKPLPWSVPHHAWSHDGLVSLLGLASHTHVQNTDRD